MRLPSILDELGSLWILWQKTLVIWITQPFYFIVYPSYPQGKNGGSSRWGGSSLFKGITKLHGDRSFDARALRLWNALPVDIKRECPLWPSKNENVYVLSVTVLTLWVAPPEMFCNWCRIQWRRDKLWNCTPFRHPTDEQLQHRVYIFSNYYHLQSVRFEYVAHYEKSNFFIFRP